MINENLRSKIPLKFTEGRFKILMVSDFQETLTTCEKTLACYDKLIEQEKPDLVVWGGDNCDCHNVYTEESLKKYLDLFSEPTESRSIPWMHVFGNHDHDLPVTRDFLIDLYESYPHCISKHLDPAVHGISNYVNPVIGGDGKPAFLVWALDSGDFYRGDGCHIENYKRPPHISVWDYPRFDQLMWYYNSSCEIEAYAGKKVNGMLFVHIAPHEFQYAVDNAEILGTTGGTSETMSLGAFNSGLFATVLERGDVKCIACGHTHKNTFESEFFGVKMCFDGSAGYHPYGIDELRGGRIFEIYEDKPDKINTRIVYYKDLK